MLESFSEKLGGIFKKMSGQGRISEANIQEAMRELRFTNASSGVGVLMDLEEQRVLFADPALLRSMFVQLYYLDGRYSDHFIKFYDRSGTSGRVVIWKVDWTGTVREQRSDTTADRTVTQAGSSASISSASVPCPSSVSSWSNACTASAPVSATQRSLAASASA